MSSKRARRISRRDFLKGTAAAIATVPAAGILAACGQSTAPSASPPASSAPASVAPSASASASAAAATPDAKARAAALYEAAKKEGTVSWYASTTANDAQALIKAFEKTYPGVKVEHYRANSEELREKAITEFKAGRYEMDALESGMEDFPYFIEAGLLKKHEWPSANKYPKGLVDSDGYWIASRIIPGAITYNTKLVPKAEAPKSYQDLLDPKWKGKIGIEEDEVIWFMGMLGIMGKEKGLEYMRNLAKQEIQLRKGHSAMQNLLMAGEFSIHVYLYLHSVVPDKYEKKAPIDWVNTSPLTTGGTLFSIAAKPKHPNGAQLWAEWVTSEEGQATYAEVGRVPAMKGIKLKYQEMSEGIEYFALKPADFGKPYDEATQQFRDIFWPKKT